MVRPRLGDDFLHARATLEVCAAGVILLNVACKTLTDKDFFSSPCSSNVTYLPVLTDCTSFLELCTIGVEFFNLFFLANNIIQAFIFFIW